MKQWEYKIYLWTEFAHPEANAKGLETNLSALGKVGWELVAVVESKGRWLYHFKRGLGAY